MAASRRRASSLVTNSSWTDSCTIAVPSDVQRWPAVPKPPNSAPSTASGTFASSITTIGFLPPSSRHGDCRWRPQSSPTFEPTALEPVKPTLSTRPSSSDCSRPLNVSSPLACTRFRTPAGTPPARNSLASASPSAAAYSAGFQTTAFPHRIAGTRYQAGTATGKLPAVMIAATPTGMRNVNSCLSGISDGTVCPYSRRPSPRKKSHVSTISWTSPSDSAYGLPTSCVTRRESASLLASTSRPTCAITRPRAGAGTFAHSYWAARAARAASTNVAASPSATSATTSSVRAGFVEMRTGPSRRTSPPMIEPSLVPEAMVDMPVSLEAPERPVAVVDGADDPRALEIDSRIAVEDDEVGRVAGREPPVRLLAALEPGRHLRPGAQRVPERQPLLRAPLAQYRGADAVERVERLDRRVGAAGEPYAGAVQRGVRVRALDPVAPQALRDRLVRDRHRRLDRGGDAERGEARDVVGVHALRVLDPRAQSGPRLARRFERVQRIPRG